MITGLPSPHHMRIACFSATDYDRKYFIEEQNAAANVHEITYFETRLTEHTVGLLPKDSQLTTAGYSRKRVRCGVHICERQRKSSCTICFFPPSSLLFSFPAAGIAATCQGWCTVNSTEMYRLESLGPVCCC